MTTPPDSPPEQLPEALAHLREAFRIIKAYGVPSTDPTVGHDPLYDSVDRGHLDWYVDEGNTLAALDAVIAHCEAEVEDPKAARDV